MWKAKQRSARGARIETFIFQRSFAGGRQGYRKDFRHSRAGANKERRIQQQLGGNLAVQVTNWHLAKVRIAD